MSARRTVYDDLADKIRSLVRDEAAAVSPPLERWKVVQGRPLVIESMDGDVRLEEGDPDVEIDRYILSDDGRPRRGDTVLVLSDGEDWIVQGVLDDGDED